MSPPAQADGYAIESAKIVILIVAGQGTRLRLAAKHIRIDLSRFYAFHAAFQTPANRY
jgi:hypothetical protein